MKSTLSAFLMLAMAPGLGGFSPGATEAPTPGGLSLARDGHTDFSIILPPRPSQTEQFGALELQRYLGLISGARFDTVSNLPPHSILVCNRASVPVGVELPDGLSRLPAEGFCLAVRGGRLMVIGADDRGTLYAVYALLERLGCRWLAPAFACYQGASEVVPRQQTLSLALASDLFEQPVMKYRKLYVEEGHSHTTENLRQMIEWLPKRRFNTLVVPLNYGGRGRVMWDNWRRALTPELQRRGLWIEVGGHGYENFLHADMEGGRLFERNPEWFGLDEAGRRVRTTRAVFCTSNRQAKDYFLGHVLDYLNTHPEIQIFDFWPPDGARWCQCAACQALGSPSDRQALLLAEVAAAVRARHPSLRFETIAYAACVAPPSRAVLDPRVLIDFCPIAQCFEFQINDPKAEKNADYVSQLKAWLPSFKGDLSLYSYYRKYAWQSLPNLIPHYMQEDLRFYREAGVRGVSSYAEPGDWAAYELNHYVLGALAWNPDTDVEATVAEFAQGRFGGQAALALRAYSLLEDDVRDFCSLPGTTLKSPADYQGPAESLRGLASQLNRAADAEEAAGPRAALRRLALTVGYAERDLLLQQARAANADHQQRRAILDNLTRFLNAHRGEGIFLLDRISADKQAARYGLNQE